MPVMNGYEAIKTIRELEARNSNRETRVIIIAVTAGTFEFDQEHSHFEWNALLRKPFRPADIITILQNSLDLKNIHTDSNTENIRETARKLPISEITPEVLASLPVEWMEKLRRAVEAIDVEATDALIDRIIPQTPELAATFKQLVQHYRFDVLQMLLEPKES